ncbi:hypothetical protein NPIL_49491 [Nephila pilipes]|uniref:Transmembrane protein n=1 Tax=Nephila pilipes TaxID=299642 RepID=A0A8X6Q2X9_NEPPI|nr:hypothetical protein NPIL_49491 [Nephila pilipes]
MRSKPLFSDNPKSVALGYVKHFNGVEFNVSQFALLPFQVSSACEALSDSPFPLLSAEESGFCRAVFSSRPAVQLFLLVMTWTLVLFTLCVDF